MASSTPSTAEKVPEKKASFTENLLPESYQQLGRDVETSAKQIAHMAPKETPKQRLARVRRTKESLWRLSSEIEENTRTEVRQDLETAVKLAESGDDRAFDAVAQKMKTSPQISENPMLQEKIDTILVGQDQYGRMAKQISELKNLRSRVPDWMWNASDKARNTHLNFKEVLDKYYIVDPKTGKYRAKNAFELAKEAYQTDGAWGFVKTLFTGSYVSQYTEKAELGINTLEAVQGKMVEFKNAHGDDIVKAKETAVITGKNIDLTYDRYKQVQLENPRSFMEAREAVRRAREKMRQNKETFQRTIAQNPTAKPEKFKGAIDAFKSTFKEISEKAKKDPAFGQALSKAQPPLRGINIAKGVGGRVVMSMAIRGLREAIHEGDPRKFLDNIANSNAWLEALPIYGTIRSGMRLMQDNGDPSWLKWGEFGLNLGLDAMFLATGGGSALLRFGWGAARKGVFKLAGKQAANVAVKEGVKVGAKEAASEGAQVAAKQVAKEVGGEGAEQAAKQVTEAVVKKSMKRKIAETIGTSGMFALALEGLDMALEKFIPIEDIKATTVEFATDYVTEKVDPYLTPGLKALIEESDVDIKSTMGLAV